MQVEEKKFDSFLSIFVEAAEEGIVRDRKVILQDTILFLINLFITCQYSSSIWSFWYQKLAYVFNAYFAAHLSIFQPCHMCLNRVVIPYIFFCVQLLYLRESLSTWIMTRFAFYETCNVQRALYRLAFVCLRLIFYKTIIASKMSKMNDSTRWFPLILTVELQISSRFSSLTFFECSQSQDIIVESLSQS